MFSERGFIRPDIEMLGRLIQERDSVVVVVGVPEDALPDRSLRFPAFCNALGERRSQRGRNC